jgi:hypothetical protein
LFICFSGQTMLMMNSFVSKQEKRTKLRSINKICSLIAEEGRSSKQTLAFFSLFFYAHYSGHSRHTLYIGWLWSECRSFFSFQCTEISPYIKSRVGVCGYVCSFHHKIWDISPHDSYTLFTRDIFGYTTEYKKGQHVSIVHNLFQIFLISSFYLQIYRQKLCQTLNRHHQLLFLMSMWKWKKLLPKEVSSLLLFDWIV